MVSYCQTEGVNTFHVVKLNAASVGSYEVDMLYNNFVDGIIQPEFRALDGELLLYNKINGMKVLAECVKTCLISVGQAASLIEAVCSVAMEADEYMLDPDNLLISMDYIYYDPDSQSYRFIYMPGNEKDVRGQIKRLVEELIKKIVHRDASLVDFMYGAYDRVVSPAFDVGALMKYVEDERKVWISDNDSEKTVKASVSRDEELLDSLFGQEQTECSGEGQYRGMGLWNTVGKKPACAEGGRYAILFAAMTLTIMAGAALLVIQLSGYGHIVEVRPFMLLLILFCVELFIYLELRRKDIHDIHTQDESVTGQDRAAYSDEMDEPVQCTAAGIADDAPESDTELLVDALDETTILADAREEKTDMGQLLLHMFDASGDRQIQVSSRPTVIGRGLTGVDVPVVDREISRKHVRVYELEGNVYAEDMGSTNGTFVNDIRLQVGKRWPLTDGDHLRIGGHEYSIQISLI